MRVVFLSGPGGAGKTTAGRMAHEVLSGDWLYFEVDRCQPSLSPAPTVSDERLTWATLRAVRAYVDEGLPLLVEMDVSGGRRRIVDAVFEGVPTTFVVVTAEREVAMGRVLARGTAPEFLATYERLYRKPWGDMEGVTLIDSTEVPAELVADQLVRLVKVSG